MNQYTEILLSAIAAYEAKCGISPESILESLWYEYSCRNPVDDGQIRAVESKFSPIFSELPLESSDKLFDLIGELLTVYQRAAYLDGLRIGAALLCELAVVP